jgi:hypothetical protein
MLRVNQGQQDPYHFTQRYPGHPGKFPNHFHEAGEDGEGEDVFKLVSQSSQHVPT